MSLVRKTKSKHEQTSLLLLQGSKIQAPRARGSKNNEKKIWGVESAAVVEKSSLGYLFGGGETATANKTPKTTNSTPPSPQNASPGPAPALAPAPASSPSGKQLPAGIHSKPTNNYLRVDGQNCGNFITDRPSTKVHAAPGGRSSLGYLFGGGSGN